LTAPPPLSAQHPRLCVFCGARKGRNPNHAEAARMLGAEIARRNWGLVYGGGCVGLMGELADAALAGGASVIGVIPDALVAREQAHRGLTDLREVRTMHERKALMHDLADAFVALPGGIGTFEELCEAVTWSSIGYHTKPVALLDVGGFFGPLLTLFDHAVAEGFMFPELRAGLIVDDEPARLLDRLARSVQPSVAARQGLVDTHQ
jgi:uncharacterized protein (TIGR00730 family)